MANDEINYYRGRASSERALAEVSTNPTVARIHAEMAELYDKLVLLEPGSGMNVTPFNRASISAVRDRDDEAAEQAASGE